MWSSFTKWVLWLIVWSCRFVVWPYTRCVSIFRRKTAMPPISSTLLMESATNLTIKIRKREVTCEEVVKTYIERIQAVNPLLNCVVQDRFDQALEEARTVDLKLAGGGESEEELWKNKPLLGIPLTVKESIALKGMSNNSGRVKPKERIATEDATVVTLLKNAGAIPLVVSNTPEVCMCWETFNNVTGRTNNPYDIRRTPGGSSGGEAALLASAGSVLGLGSDIGGSGRLPALFCGVYGHKPSPGYIPIDGHIPSSEDEEWATFFTFVPMCRYAEDLPLFLNSMIPDPEKAQELRLFEPVDLKKIKLFYMESDSSITSDKVHPEIKSAMRRTIDYFADKHDVKAEEVKIKEVKEMLQLAGVLLLRIKACHSVYQKTEDNLTEWNSVILTYLKFIARQTKHTHPPLIYGPLKKYADSISQKDIDEMLHIKKELMKKFHDILGDDGVFLYPTFPDLANFHLQFYYKILNVGYFTLFNVVELPVTACPAGLARDGRPVGFQIAASRGQDRLTLAVAKEVESALGGWVPPPSQPLPNPKSITASKVTDDSSCPTEVVCQV